MKEERIAKANLRVINWNCRSLTARGVLADKVIYGADIVCLQETRLGTADYNLDDFHAYYSRVGHGQAIFVRSSIRHSCLDVSRWATPSLHLSAVELQDQPVRNVINVYACNATMTEEHWNALGELEESLPGTTMFCGDFNARGREWGNVITNPQGTALEDALDKTSLVCLNSGSMTRFANQEGHSDSAIDLTLVSVTICDDCMWETLECHGSDHVPCLSMVRRKRSQVKKKVKRAFTYSTDESDIVSKLRQKALPVKRGCVEGKEKPPWWNDETERLWEEKRSALRAYQRALRANQRDIDKERLKEEERSASRAFKRAAQEAKDEIYEDFCINVNEDRALFLFWKLYRDMQSKQRVQAIPDFQTEDGVWVRTEEEKGKALFERYRKQTDQNNEAERRETMTAITRNYDENLFTEFITYENVEYCAKHTTSSAPGPDGVRYAHIKALEEADLRALAEKLNDSLWSGEIPEDWLDSHLAVIPKPDKDSSKIASYRILTMQNTVGKLPEKIVAQRLAAELEEKEVLPPELGSYRKGKVTWMNAAKLASDIYDGFEKGEETLVIALDLEDAYNRVQYNVLMRTLANLEISPQLVRWIGTALLKRKVALRLGAWASDPTEITPGLPQGSALSPVLFNVYTAGITSNQFEGPGRTLSFADDVLTSRRGKVRQEIADSAQAELNRIDGWCDDNNGKLHSGKAAALWCSLNNKAVKDEMPKVFIDGNEINRVHLLPYLGLLFDRTLSFSEHTTKTISKARKGLQAMRAVAAKGISQRILLLLYQTLVLSKIEYGFGLMTLADTHLKRLDTIQNEAMRIILGCTKDTSAAAMRHYLDLPTMKERHKMAQVQAYLRVSADETNPLHEKVGRVMTSRLKRGTEWMTQAANTISQCCDVDAIRRGKVWFPVHDPQGRYTKVVSTLGRECREWPTGATNAEILTLVDEHSRPGVVVVFTDGSVLRGIKSGWGFSARVDGVIVAEDSGAFAQTTSSMCMEVRAITEALEWLRDSGHAHVIFVTDSMSTLDLVRQGMHYADWKPLITASQLESITWIFSPGHAGVLGNERADVLAGEAVIKGDLIMDPPAVRAAVQEMLSATRVEEDSYTLDRLKEKNVARGDGRQGMLHGPAKRRANQLLMETISIYTLRWTLQRRGESLWTSVDDEEDP
jgi:ribonuclease HI